MYPSLAAAALIVPVVAALLGSTPPHPVTPTDSATCSWTPTGPVTIGVGEEQTFGSALGCSGYSVDITPANGTAGFTSGTACSLTSITTTNSGLFKVRGCATGSVTVTVRSGSTVIQTISVSVGP